MNRDKAACLYILFALNDSLMLDVYLLSTSSAIWDYLITMFEKKTIIEILYLFSLLDKLQFKAGTSMSSHIESFKGIMNQLSTTRDPIS